MRTQDAELVKKALEDRAKQTHLLTSPDDTGKFLVPSPVEKQQGLIILGGELWDCPPKGNGTVKTENEIRRIATFLQTDALIEEDHF